MPTEIERKFLLRNDSWRDSVTSSVKLRDGLIALAGERKVRVRTADNRATLTLKGARTGFTRDEFEYDIPHADAERLLSHHCDGRVVSKTRHFVNAGATVFQVDEYDGLLAGVVVAEVELTSPDQWFPRPDWLGEEITGRAEYRKINMLRERLSKAPSVRGAGVNSPPSAV